MSARFASTLLLSLAALGCIQETDTPVRSLDATQAGARESPALEQYGQVGLMLRGGDPSEGRQAFLDLKCTVCHRVTGETDFPEPFGDQGPVLDAALGSRPEGYVATAIIAPSHSISINVSDEVKTEMSGVLSPMADYSGVMTVRQILDLMAYLETIGD